jgi:hypothetical protein
MIRRGIDLSPQRVTGKRLMKRSRAFITSIALAAVDIGRWRAVINDAKITAE